MRLLSVLLISLVPLACSPASSERIVEAEVKPIVIAHRGASGLRPEHTLEAYRLAIAQGADFIEPDLVMTKDGVLVARHDPWLSDSTDIADRPEFADRRTTVTDPEGREMTDWFVWDFTLEEIRTLTARQVRPGRTTQFDGLYGIPTYDEIAELARAEGERVGKVVGLYPETKWPSHHRERGLDMEEAMVTALERFGHTGKESPVYVQSFEPWILKALDKRVDTPLIQLVYPLGWTAEGEPSVSLEEIADFADGVGPYKWLVLSPETGASTGYAEAAREMGLLVHPWTFRDDDLPDWTGTGESEIAAVLAAGATGFFTDFPETGRNAVDSPRLD